MRRLAIAALSAGIVLSACTEEPRETPTEATPSAPSQVKTVTGSCQTPFPLTDLLMKTGSMFSGASVGHAADSKIQTIGAECAKGKVGPARHHALTFVDWMLKKYGQDQLPNGSALKMTDVISTLFVAVGFQDGEIDPGAFGPGGAAGVYDEDSDEDFLLQNENKSLALKISAHCLPSSFISMVRLPDGDQLINTGGRRQFPPFYDINAANPEGDKTIAPECADLLVGFCVDDAVLAQTDNPQIGHNKADDATTEENEEGQFEVLRAANSDEYGQLDLAFCPAQANPGFNEEFGLSPAGGLEGLALSAWHRARGYVRPLTNIVLPQQLHATTLGGLGLGGGGRSISPHGVVDDVVLESRFDGDPEGQTFEENSTISWNCEGTCFPAVRVMDFFDTGVAGADVNVALVQVAGSGELTDGEGGTPGPVTTDESGSAVFDDLRITAPGTYQLEFTTRGNTIPLLSGEFTVELLDEPLQLNLEAVERLPGGTQRFTVQGEATGPFIWSVNGDDGGNSTFGVIAVADDDPNSADYTAPGTVPSPATFDVCARRELNPSNTACASVTIQPVPSSGADIIVFNDVNIFDETAALDANNIQLFKNLLNFTTTGTRNSVDGVLIHRGHGSLCGPDAFPDAGCVWTTFEATLTGEGSTVVTGDDITTPLTSIGPDVKLIILVVPMESYSTAEVNSLKSFAGQGGRILFVGEHEGFYGSEGIAIENDFLGRMGAVLHNTGGLVDCNRKILPSTSLRDHQITTGLTQLTVSCASVVEPGPNDYALFYALNGTQVLGAVAKIDLTPLAGLRVATPARLKRSSALQANGVRGIDVFSWGYSPRE